jgi:hypothetical protein
MAVDDLAAGWDALAQGSWDTARASFGRALAVEETPEALEGLGWAGVALAQITRKAMSSAQRRSMARAERSPTASAYSSRATIMAGSWAARPQPSSR